MLSVDKNSSLKSQGPVMIFAAIFNDAFNLDVMATVLHAYNQQKEKVRIKTTKPLFLQEVCHGML